MDTLINIGLGAIGSIVATIILYLCSHLYRIGYKENFEFDLENAYIAVYQIENHHLFPNDYLLVMEQIEHLRYYAFSMYKSLTPLCMLGHKKEKKLVITLLYDIMRMCEVSKYTTIGYYGEKEHKARLERVHELFYKHKLFDEENVSTVHIQLELIKELIKGKTICLAFNEITRMYRINWCDSLLESAFIEINSFRIKDAGLIKKKCLYYSEYKRMVNNYLMRQKQRQSCSTERKGLIP